MARTYSEDEMLQLSGIQHYMFCPRQWALIHIDCEWKDNVLTAEGSLQHEKADSPFYRPKFGDKVRIRRMSVASPSLGLYGLTDVVELSSAGADDENSIYHPEYAGRWRLLPVEYKHGRPKKDFSDKVQVAAQAIALEEMFGITINEGAVFYWEIRHRETFAIDDNIRAIAKEAAEAMHEVYTTGIIPLPEYSGKCHKCSLYDICLPKSFSKSSVLRYLNKYLYNNEETS